MVRRCSVWCGVAQYGASLLSMVRRCSVWCVVAQYGAALLSYGAALLSMVRRCSVMVRRRSVGSASACCKAGPSSILALGTTGTVFPTELTKRWGDGERPRRTATDMWIVWMGLNVCLYCKLWKQKINKKSGILPPTFNKVFYFLFVGCLTVVFVCLPRT